MFYQQGVARNHMGPHARVSLLGVLVLDNPEGVRVQVGRDGHLLQPAELGASHGRRSQAL